MSSSAIKRRVRLTMTITAIIGFVIGFAITNIALAACAALAGAAGIRTLACVAWPEVYGIYKINS